MLVPAWMLGAPGSRPFVGHLRGAARHGDAWMAVAGRVAAEAGVVAGWEASRALLSALDGIGTRAATLGRGRAALVRAFWGAVGEVPRDALGPERGADASLLVVAGDETGVGVSGVGLSGVWGRRADGGWSLLVEGDHPLLSAPGLPAHVPGVLLLDVEVTAVVAAPRPLDAALPAASEIETRCGVHP